MRYIAVSLVLTAYVFLNLIMPKIASGLTIYLLTITCWLTVAFAILKISLKEGANLLSWRLSKPLILNAAMIGILQIVILAFAGLFTAFGKSPYAFTPIAIIINISYFSSALLGLELSRAYLIKSFPKRKVFIGVTSIALFYTFITIPLTKFITPKTAAETAKFLGSDLLPTLSQSLLATYLALLGGPTASIAYLGVLESFEWLCPILPNPPWAIKSLITTLIPVVGFLAVTQTVSPFKLMKLGLVSRSETRGKIRRKQKTSSTGWIAIALIAVILVWGSTGLLGFQPSIIASGSMRPTLDVGDIAITVQTSPDKIKVGDVIQYWRQGEPASTIHRVIEIYKSEGITYIVTKGDANNAPDDPITLTPTQKIGKLVFTIPKLGWISIYLKEFFANAWAFLANNPTATYATIGITLISSAYAIHTYRNQPIRRLRRRLKR